MSVGATLWCWEKAPDFATNGLIINNLIPDFLRLG